MLETILTIVWLISFSMISKKSMFFKNVNLAITSRFATTNENKKKSIKHWIFAFLMRVIMFFERRRNDVINLNDVERFFAYLTSFHVFWASSITSNTAFRWMIRRVFRIIRFLIAFVFLQIWSVCFVFSWTTSSSWNVLRAWFARIRVKLHFSSNSKMTRIDVLNFEINAFMISTIAMQINMIKTSI
jgi:hypothetical protein